MQRKQTALITFMRHGEKDAMGDLTQKGTHQAGRRGTVTPNLDGDILLFHSGSGRVRSTIQTMAMNLDLSETDEIRYETGKHIIDYVVPNLHYLIDSKVKGTYHDTWNKLEEERNKTGDNTKMREFYNLDWRSPEPGVWFSPRQMAQNIAQMIGIEVRFANMTETKHVVNIVNGSHEPVLTSFLVYFLQEYAFRSCDPIWDLGGPINFAESFDIAVYHTSERDFEIELVFRGESYPVNLDTTRAFAYSG